MAITITIGIQKGGSAKTTTSGVLSYLLSEEHNYKVLAVDMDSQGNLTEMITQQDVETFRERSILEALQEQNPKEYIYPYSQNLHLLPAEDLLATFSRWLYIDYKGLNHSLVLKSTLDKVKDQYDFIIIDTPPALGDQTINALFASDYVVTMFETGQFCYSALSRFFETIEAVQKRKSDLKVAGILCSMIDNRRSDNQEYLKLVQEEYGNITFQTVIQRRAATGRLAVFGFHDNKELDQAVEQYREFTKELIDRVQ